MSKLVNCPFCDGKIYTKHLAGLIFFKCEKCGGTISFDNDECNKEPSKAHEYFNSRPISDNDIVKAQADKIFYYEQVLKDKSEEKERLETELAKALVVAQKRQEEIELLRKAKADAVLTAYKTAKNETAVAFAEALKLAVCNIEYDDGFIQSRCLKQAIDNVTSEIINNKIAINSDKITIF